MKDRGNLFCNRMFVLMSNSKVQRLFDNILIFCSLDEKIRIVKNGDYRTLGIDDYYNAKSYAYLYKSLGDGDDAIKLDTLSITMISKGFPCEMVFHIERYQGGSLQRESAGIYHIVGADIKLQIVVTDEFEDESLECLLPWMFGLEHSCVSEGILH